MQVLTQEEVALLSPHLRALVELAEGRRPPTTDAQRLFLECAKGLRLPVTHYEIAFCKWQRTKPTLETPVNPAQQENTIGSQQESPVGKKLRHRKKSRSGMSAAKAKSLSSSRWTKLEIKEHHRKSGYNKIKAAILSGGAVNPR